MHHQSLILIGASTGGPGRIHTILESLGANFKTPIIIAQHMAANFIPSFVKQLQVISPLTIHAIEQNQKIEPSNIYLCTQTSQLLMKGSEVWVKILSDQDHPYNPEIDTLFKSAARLTPHVKILGIILTGIGEDGAQGSLALNSSGASCYFENEQSATVYGMPRRAKELVSDAPTGNVEDIIRAIHQFGESRV